MNHVICDGILWYKTKNITWLWPIFIGSSWLFPRRWPTTPLGKVLFFWNQEQYPSITSCLLEYKNKSICNYLSNSIDPAKILRQNAQSTAYSQSHSARSVGVVALCYQLCYLLFGAVCYAQWLFTACITASITPLSTCHSNHILHTSVFVWVHIEGRFASNPNSQKDIQPPSHSIVFLEKFCFVNVVKGVWSLLTDMFWNRPTGLLLGLKVAKSTISGFSIGMGLSEFVCQSHHNVQQRLQ